MRIKLTPKRIKASYEGAGTGRRAAGWDAPDGALNTLAVPNLPRLRKRARAAVRNDPYAFSAIERRVSNLIGTGITPRARIDDAALRIILHALWEDWTEESDADGLLDFYGQQALIARMVEESGECFVRLRPRRPEDGLAVPLQLQVLAPEFVPLEKTETTRSGNRIKAGIEFDLLGRRVAYWMHRKHPGDALDAGQYQQLVRVPASEVLHIFEPTEAGQLRGVPRLAPVLLRLKSLDNYDDAVLFRQEVANLFAGFIRKPAQDSVIAPVDAITGGQVQPDADGFTPMVGMEPGSMQELLPGEEVEFSTPPDAGNTYVDFMRQQLQAAAAGVGLPYELLTGDMRDVNDRLMRVVLNEFRRRIEQLQFGLYVHQLCRPVRAAWLDMAILAGAVVLPNYVARRRDYLRTRWVAQGWAYINPVQDVQARQMEVAAGFTSRSEVVLRSGYDAEQIDQENAEDNARAERLGLHYGSTATGAAPTDPQDQTP